jgi:hypothetical protein
MMRRLARTVPPAVLGVAIAVFSAASGCGGEETPEPAVTPDPVAQSRVGGDPQGVERALALGDGVAVIDLAGTAGARPRELEIAKDATLEDLRWRGWGEAQAEASGSVRALICEPTCANGRIRHWPTRVVLSGLITCGDGRFYGTAEVTYRPKPGASKPLAAYIGAPC